jgi:hypothetical protein
VLLCASRHEYTQFPNVIVSACGVGSTVRKKNSKSYVVINNVITVYGGLLVCWLVAKILRDAATQKTAICTRMAVQTSNLTPLNFRGKQHHTPEDGGRMLL